MTGAGVLAASIVRRDRVKTLAWAVAIAVLVFYTVTTYKSTYSSPEELASYGRIVEESPAARAFSGPGYGLAEDPSPGAVTANETLSFLAVAFGLMSIFLVVRNTRAEEEDGRAELLAAGCISRGARSVAALTVLVGVNALLGAALAAMLAAFGLGAEGSLLYGAALAGVGLFFGAAALLAAQLSVHARVANAIAGASLGAAYLIRALGDMAGSWVSWLSPIGWAQQVRPFAGDRAWVLALLLGGAALLAVAALAVEARRDLGAGAIGSRPGPAVGKPWLSHPLGLPFRLQRLALAGWAIGVAVLGVTYGSVTDEVERMIADNPELADFLARTGGDLVGSYFATVLLIVALVATGFATQSLLRIRAEETTGRAEAMLAFGLSRLGWVAGYLVLTTAGVVAIVVLGGAATGLGYAATGGPAGDIGRLALIGLAWAPAVLAAAGLVVCVIAFLPRFSQAAWVFLGLFAVLGFLGQSLDLPSWLLNLSPFEHVPRAPAEDLAAAPILALTAAAAALTAAAALRLRARDIA